MKELINPLIEKVELRKIANDYNRTCKELFGIGEEEERREGGRHRRTPKKRGENNRKIPSIGWEGEDEELGNDYNSRIFNVEVNDNGESGRELVFKLVDKDKLNKNSKNGTLTGLFR